MGLDQYLYSGEGNDRSEIFYWRKHPSLHGLMYEIAVGKGLVEEADDFNCVAVPLTLADLDLIEQRIRSKTLPKTSGLFFGSSADEEEWRARDLKAIEMARSEIKYGNQVFYDSWW